MGKVWTLLRTYFRKHFNPVYFTAVVLFTAALVTAEYTWDIERRFIDNEYNSLSRLLRYCLMYFVAFGGGYALYLFDKKNRKLLLRPALWLFVILAVVLFSVRTWFHHHGFITANWVSPAYQTIATKCIINLQGLVFLFLPLVVFWFFADRRNQPVYGFRHKSVALRPYGIMLLIMLPLIIAAATQADFLDTYPRAFHLNLPAEKEGNGWLTLLYELCYASDFVTTEFFFRGFLILAMARFAGPNVILPMCVFYVVIHFGKPLGETISSFLGGWLLGILAYETKSIYGGIIVHLGIALMMELVAFIAHSL